MKVVKLLVRTLVLGAVVAAFFGVPYCKYAVKLQGLVWGLAATLLLGRFFCDALCPLGILQSLANWLFHPRTHVRRVCSRLPETKCQRIIRWVLLLAAIALSASGAMGAVTMIVPISIFGKAISLWWPGVVAFALVMLLAAIGQGRIWCNWICPFGTLYNLVAKVTPCKNKVGAGCGNCRRCFTDADAKPETTEKDGITRRETLKGVAVLAVADKVMDGGFADVTLPGSPDRAVPVLPPGAGTAKSFSLKCVGCQLCVTSCPGQCLIPSAKFATFGQPVMDFRHGSCIVACTTCGAVCPEGAIRQLTTEMRPHVHVGCAVWKKDLCIRAAQNGDACTACVRKCPVRAIHLVQGFPVVDREACIGCGACEHVCPARPQPAIHVEGNAVQRVVEPMGEADLRAEMRAKLDAGAAVVAARNGIIVATSEGHGLEPLLSLLDAGKLRHAVVMDRVIGRAAAAVLCVGGADKVITPLAGEGAGKLLAAHKIALEAEKTVPSILNRDLSGMCPLEQAVEGLTDPDKMVEALKRRR